MSMMETGGLFERLLLPVDSAEAFSRVTPLAGALIRSMAIAPHCIDLLHVVSGSFLQQRFGRLDLASGQLVPADDLKRLRNQYLTDTVEPLLDECAALLEKEAGCRPLPRLIRDGDPVKVISTLCRDVPYSTLLMGRQRMMPGESRQSGSITASLLHRHVGASVYLVGDEPLPPGTSSFARCLIGVDGSVASRNAVKEAGLLLSRMKYSVERILLVHVLDQSCYYDEDGMPCSQSGPVGQRALEEAVTVLTDAGVDPGVVTTVIHFGRPGSVLVEEAGGCDATAVFIGTRDRSRTAQIYLGSVCTDIVYNCRNRVVVLVS